MNTFLFDLNPIALCSSNQVVKLYLLANLIFETYLIELNFKAAKNVLGLMRQICLILNNVPFLMEHL